MTPERRSQIEAIKKAFEPRYGHTTVEYDDENEIIYATCAGDSFRCEIGSDDDTMLFVAENDSRITVEVRWPLDLQDTSDPTIPMGPNGNSRED